MRHQYFYKEVGTRNKFSDMFSLIKYIYKKGTVIIDCYITDTKEYYKTKTFTGIKDMGNYFIITNEENGVLHEVKIPFTLKEILA